jgi:fido (protein-threonine AMPylation protein)
MVFEDTKFKMTIGSDAFVIVRRRPPVPRPQAANALADGPAPGRARNGKPLLASRDSFQVQDGDGFGAPRYPGGTSTTAPKASSGTACGTCSGAEKPPTVFQGSDPWANPMDPAWSRDPEHAMFRIGHLQQMNKPIPTAEQNMLLARGGLAEVRLGKKGPIDAAARERLDAARMPRTDNTPDGIRARENWIATDAWVREQVARGEKLTPEKLNEMHRRLLDGLPNNGTPAGLPRGPDNDAWVRASNGGTYFGPMDVPPAVEAALKRANQPGVDAAIRAGELNKQLKTAHPYTDANSRLSALAGDWILQGEDLPPGVWKRVDPFDPASPTGAELGVSAVEAAVKIL